MLNCDICLSRMACHLSQETEAKTQLSIQSLVMDTGIRRGLSQRISMKNISGFCLQQSRDRPHRRLALFCGASPSCGGGGTLGTKVIMEGIKSTGVRPAASDHMGPSGCRLAPWSAGRVLWSRPACQERLGPGSPPSPLTYTGQTSSSSDPGN